MTALQNFPSSNKLADSFADFFEDKITTIQTEFDCSCDDISFTEHCLSSASLAFFHEISSENMLKIIVPLI